ncbi:hypothetical protein HZA97_06320 [Candidatus Woesearchaeota archaeon]|nr:hypothetical protein [Candidatus Woesearchaeota archaeon]
MKPRILGDKKKSSFDDNLADYVNGIFDKMPDVVAEKKDISKDNSKLGVTDYTSFRLDEFIDSYKLTNLMHYGELCSFIWDKKLLDGGKGHTQDEWIKITSKLPDVSVYFSTFLALYENKDGPQAELIEKVKQMFLKDFSEDFMMTSTRVIYKTKGVDELIHDYGVGFHPHIHTTVIGKRGDIIYGGDNVIPALFDTSDYQKVNEVFKWITGKDAYLWRYEHKLSNDKDIAVFLGGSAKFGINACEGYANIRPARGVSVVREKFSREND